MIKQWHHCCETAAADRQQASLTVRPGKHSILDIFFDQLIPASLSTEVGLQAQPAFSIKFPAPRQKRDPENAKSRHQQLPDVGHILESKGYLDSGYSPRDKTLPCSIALFLLPKEPYYNTLKRHHHMRSHNGKATQNPTTHSEQ